MPGDIHPTRALGCARAGAERHLVSLPFVPFLRGLHLRYERRDWGGDMSGSRAKRVPGGWPAWRAPPHFLAPQAFRRVSALARCRGEQSAEPRNMCRFGTWRAVSVFNRELTKMNLARFLAVFGRCARAEAAEIVGDGVFVPWRHLE